jgi:phosphoribosylanthranilate isomerase
VTRVKICGINDPASCDAAIEAGADWVGFLFFPPSPRYLAPRDAAVLSARAMGRSLRVALFVSPSAEEIARVLDVVPIDILQVYGRVGDLPSLRDRFGLPVWRACGIAKAEDLPVGADGADAYVLDTKPAPGATRPGGNALSFDWSLLPGWTAPAPWILAGGLTAANVRGAIQATGASGVDVSSGVEIRPGVKDPALIRAFVEIVRPSVSA